MASCRHVQVVVVVLLLLLLLLGQELHISIGIDNLPSQFYNFPLHFRVTAAFANPSEVRVDLTWQL